MAKIRVLIWSNRGGPYSSPRRRSELAARLGGFLFHVARMLSARVKRSREILPFFRLQKGNAGRKRERDRTPARLRKVENLNSGAVPPPRCDRRWLVSGDWLAAGKGVRDPSTGVEEICAVTPGRRRVHVRPNPVPCAPEYDSRRRPSRACSRGSCRRLRRRRRRSRAWSCFLFRTEDHQPYHLAVSCSYRVAFFTIPRRMNK